MGDLLLELPHNNPNSPRYPLKLLNSTQLIYYRWLLCVNKDDDELCSFSQFSFLASLLSFFLPCLLLMDMFQYFNLSLAGFIAHGLSAIAAVNLSKSTS
jgi:hypothetical protein